MTESPRVVKRSLARIIWGTVTILLGITSAFFFYHAFSAVRANGYVWGMIAYYVFLTYAIGAGVLGLISCAIWLTRKGHVDDVEVEYDAEVAPFAAQLPEWARKAVPPEIMEDEGVGSAIRKVWSDERRKPLEPS